MSTRIPVNTSTAWGAALAEAVDGVIEVKAKVDRLKAVFDSMAQGGTFIQVDTEVNGGTPDATRGELIYNLLAGAKSALDGAAIGELTRLDQG